MVRKSKIFTIITIAVLNKKLRPTFNVSDVNKCCNNLLIKSPAFLSKYTKGNSANHKEYFERVCRGYYKVQITTKPRI